MSSYYQHNARPRPHLAIPPAGANNHLYRSPSAGALPQASSAYSYETNGFTNAQNGLQPPQRDAVDGDATPVRRENPNNPFARRDSANNPFLTPEPYSPQLPPYAMNRYASAANLRPGVGAMNSYGPPAGRPVSFVEGSSSSNAAGLGTSSYDPDASVFHFPEPELHRSTSHRSPTSTNQQAHRSTHSDVGPQVQLRRSDSDAASTYSSYSPTTPNAFPNDSMEVLTDELSKATLESEEGLRRFQAGELLPQDEEWHRLVPKTAQEAIGKKELQRQSNFFELFKAEREYVADLEAVHDVLVQPLRGANVIKDRKTEEFVQEVFWNLNEVLTFHQHMLAALFARQREQHPLIQSVSDIVLETVLQFTSAYESYIKHYPLSEKRHRDELKRNPAYRDFMSNAIQDPRIRKRDVVTFISRPVTRLPRLALLLKSILDHTDADHPDQETMPLIVSILSDFVKSTQPGIEAAEAKVKFWNVMENLVFRKGEIIDLDPQDESRSLVHAQTLARRQRSELDWHGWNDFYVVLLDHYLLIMREDKRPNGVVKYDVTSRPIPLEYLRLGQFDQPAESRKEKNEEGGLLDNLLSHTKPQYPFTIYHAAAKSTRRYTLYTNTESARAKWRNLLTEQINIHSIRRESNRWFAVNTINDTIFRRRSAQVPQETKQLFTGPITAAATFVSGGKNFLVVGCTGGIYVGVRGNPAFRRVLPFRNVISITALQQHNKLLILDNQMLLSYSLDIIARVSQSSASPQTLDASMEKVSGQDNVTVSKAGVVKGRTLVVYAVKGFRQTTIHALEVVNSPTRVGRQSGGSLSYRSFGDPFYVPRQAFDITPLSKTVAIATERGVTIIDPTNLSSSAVLLVPDFSQASSDPRASALKSRCDSSKPLGLARVDLNENMVVFEEFGCFINRHGLPVRNCCIIRWETNALAFAERWDHILLFSMDFVEIRHKPTGRLVQVIEGRNIRLLNTGPPNDTPLIMARIGKKNDQHGQSDELLELIKTSEISTPSAGEPLNRDEYWGEWDM